MKCKEHPRYKGALRPRVLCPGCWLVWMNNLHRSDDTWYDFLKQWTKE